MRATRAQPVSLSPSTERTRAWLCAALAWLVATAAAAHAQSSPPPAAAPPTEPPSTSRRPRGAADVPPPDEERAPQVPEDAKETPAPAADAPPPPPPPAQTGDYAGSGALAAPDMPQDDFAEPEQEYRHAQPREFSVRIDVLNWLLLGRLSVELEMTVWKFISAELIPVFVTAQSPIALNYARLDDPLTQHSNGLGPLSGARAGLGFWLGGEPFRGYVIRLDFSNYGYVYRGADSQGVIDRVPFTERRVAVFIGSHSRFGPFTFAGGFGLGYELHQVDRCGLTTASDGDGGERIAGRSEGCKGKQLIALDRELDERADLNGPLHPVYFEARFSLGVVF